MSIRNRTEPRPHAHTFDRVNLDLGTGGALIRHFDVAAIASHGQHRFELGVEEGRAVRGELDGGPDGLAHGALDRVLIDFDEGARLDERQMRSATEDLLEAFRLELPLVEFFDKGGFGLRRSVALHGPHRLGHHRAHDVRPHHIHVLRAQITREVGGICPRLMPRPRAPLLIEGVPVGHIGL